MLIKTKRGWRRIGGPFKPRKEPREHGDEILRMIRALRRGRRA